ncbi:MAG: hypothetical protein BalsKO_03480 [Balneolaceae bacterium]
MESLEEKDEPKKRKKSFIEEASSDIFNLDRGLPSTILNLIRSPYKVIDSHFEGKDQFVPPFRYCIFVLTVVTFISVQFIDYEKLMTNSMEIGSGEGIEETAENLSKVIPSFDWAGYFQALNEISVQVLQKFVSLVYIILMAPIMAFASKLFFKKKKEKFINHYIMMIYLLTTYSIFSLLLIPVFLSVDSNGLGLVFLSSILPLFVFLLWGMTSYLKLKGFSDYFKGILALTLGYITYSITSGVLLYVSAFVKVSL